MVIHGKIKNNSSQTLNLKWLRIENNLPNNTMESLICDTVTCWSPLKSSNTFSLGAGELGRLDVHLKPHGTSGCADILIGTYVVGDSINTFSTQNYHFSIDSNCSNGINPINTNAVRFYTNSSNQLLYFVSINHMLVNTLKIYTLNGSLVQQNSNLTENNINISLLPQGLYLIKAYNAKNEAIGVQKFIKN